MLHSSPSLRAHVEALRNSPPAAAAPVTASCLPSPATARALPQSPSNQAPPHASTARDDLAPPARLSPCAPMPLPALAREWFRPAPHSFLFLLPREARGGVAAGTPCALVTHEICCHSEQPCSLVRERLLPQRAQ